MVQIKSHVLVKGSWLPLFWWFLFRQNMASVSIDIDTEMNVWIKNDQKTLHVLLFCICISSVWCVDVHFSSFRAHFWQIRWRSGTNWCLHVSLSLPLSLTHTMVYKQSCPKYVNKSLVYLQYTKIYTGKQLKVAEDKTVSAFFGSTKRRRRKRVVRVDHPQVSPKTSMKPVRALSWLDIYVFTSYRTSTLNFCIISLFSVNWFLPSHWHKATVKWFLCLNTSPPPPKKI